MNRTDRQTLLKAIDELLRTKHLLLQLLDEEKIASKKARKADTISILRGNTIDMEDGIQKLYEGIGLLKRVRQTQ